MDPLFLAFEPIYVLVHKYNTKICGGKAPNEVFLRLGRTGMDIDFVIELNPLVL